MLKDYPEIQRLKNRLANMDLSERGDPEEWAQHIMEVYKSTAEARKRATAAGLVSGGRPKLLTQIV